MSPAAGVGRPALPRFVEPHGERGSWYIGWWSASCSAPRYVSSPHRPPRTELSHGALPPRLREQGIHPRLRDAPVAPAELVGALKPPVLTPVADRARATVEARGQLGHRAVGRRGRLVGLAAVHRRELEQPRPCERERASGRQTLGEFAEALGEAHELTPDAVFSARLVTLGLARLLTGHH